MRTHDDRGPDGHEPTRHGRAAGVTPRGASSSNPALELAAALRASPDRGRGRRDGALRALELRGTDPEWRERDDAGAEPDDLESTMVAKTATMDRPQAAEGELQHEPAAGAGQADDRPPSPAPGALAGPGALDLRGLRPPDDLLLRSPPPEPGDGQPGFDPNDLDARAARRPGPPDPDATAQLDRDLRAQGGARPPLAQTRPAGLRPQRTDRPQAPEPDRTDPRRRPLPGMTTSDAAKRAAQIRQAEQDLEAGPRLDKAEPRGAKAKRTRARPAAVEKTPPPKAQPETKKEPSPAGGDASDGAVAAWQQRQVKKAGTMKVGPVPDADRYVVTYQEAATQAAEMTPLKKLELLEKAEEAAKPADPPKDLPKLTKPSAFVEAETAVRAKADRKLPEQSMPDLEATPLGHQPEVGMKLKAGEDRQTHIVQETTGPDGKTTTVEIKVVAEGTRPGKDDKSVQVQTPKPSKDLEDSVHKLRSAGEKKRAEVKKKGGGKGQKISDDRRLAAPPVPAFAKVDVGTVVAKLLASSPRYTGQVVEEARKEFARGTMTGGETSEFLAGEQPAITEELHKIAKAANVTDAELEKKRAEEEAKLKKEVEKQHDKKEHAAVAATSAVQTKGTDISAHIDTVAAGIKAFLQEQKVLAEGGAKPEEIKREAKAGRDHIAKVVSKWRGEYKRMGTARVTALEGAKGKQQDAYAAAAEIDYREVDLQLGVKSPKDRKEDAPEYKPTRDWVKTTFKELYQNVRNLAEKASSQAEAYVTEVSEGGDQALTLIAAWEKDLLDKEKSWWDKLVDWIKSWFEDTKKQVNQWETDSTEDNNVNLSKDMIWLEKARVFQYQELSEEAITKGGRFTEEQQAMLLALKSGGDSATALAAGLVSRISQQRREGLTRKFEEKVMTWANWKDVERVGVGQGGGLTSEGHAMSKARAIYIAGVDQVGTGEQKIFDALTGLTKIQGRAVELAYAEKYKRNLRDDLKSELYDWTQQVSGSTGEWDKATALLEGNPSRAVAVELHMAMHETFLGTGWGTDSTQLFKLMKGKSPAEIAAIKREYRALYGKDLLVDASEELDDGFSTRHDSDRFVAIMANRPDVARAIEADSAMRGSIFGRTDRAGLEQVYKDVAKEVADEGDKKDWDPERVKRETAKRFAALDDMYEGIYGPDFDPSQRATAADGKKESALRTNMRSSFTWGNPKAAWNFTTSTGDLDLLLSYHDLGLAKDAPDINVAWRRQLAESNAARIQVEHRSLFSASDKEIDKALAEQYESAYRDRLREQKLKVQTEREADFDQVGKLRSEAEKLKDKTAREAKLKEAQDLEGNLKRKWAPDGPDYLARMRLARQDARTTAQGDAKDNMEALSATYDDKYKAWNKQFNFGEDKDFEDVVRGDTGWGNWLDAALPGAGPIVESLRTKDNDKTIALLEGSGYLSPEDKLYFAVLPYGSTDEDTAKEVLGDADSTESREILTRLGRRLQGQGKKIGPPTPEDDAAAYQVAQAWVLDDFSGREYQDQYVAMMGVPHTPDEHLAVAEKKLEFEQRSGPGAFADALPNAAPFGALLLLTPAAPLGGLVLSGSLLGPALKSFDAESIDLLRDEVAQLRQAKQEADALYAAGKRPGDDDYDKVAQKVSALSTRVNTAVELHRAQVDAMTDIVTNVITAIVTVVVIAVSIALSPFTGGASAAAGAALTTLMWTAAIGAVVTTLANMAVKYAMKGDAYGWEDIGYDAVVGLVEAVASALTAGLGDKFLKARFLFKMAQGGVLERIAAHGLANAAEGVIQALPGALAGNVLNDETYKQGNPFANVLLGTVTQVGMAGAMSGGLGGLMGGVKKPTHFLTPGTDAYGELWHQYKLKNPGATPDTFRLELHQKVLAGEHPSLGRKQLQEVAREQILHGLDADAAKAFKKLKVEVLPADEFTRVTRSRELGEAVVMIRGGEPTVVVKAGADFQNLHREAPHLMQTLRADTAPLVGKLDERVLAHWDQLPLETQVDLYKTKLELEIDAHEQMLRSLGSDKAMRRFDKGGWARELEYTQQTLANLKKRMKDVEHLDLDAWARSKTRPHYLEEPPRLFTKKTSPEGALHPDFKRTRALTLGEVERAHAAGYVIVPDPLSPTTPVLKPRGGVPPTEDLLLVSIGEGSNRTFKVVPRGGFPDPPAGHQWNVRESGQPFQLRKIDKRNLTAEPEEILRYHVETGETVVVGNKNWAERRVDLGKGFDQPSTFTEFEAHLNRLQKQHGLADEDLAVLRRWSSALQEIHGAPELAAHKDFLDRVFAGFEKRARLGGSLAEGQYESFYKEFRTEFAKLMADQPPPVRQKLLVGFPRPDGVHVVGLLDRLPDSASKGHFFREVVREDLKKGQRAFRIAEDFPVRHSIQEGQPKKRDFDDALRIDGPLGPNGPPPGNRMLEYKAGAGAFKDVEQALDQAEFFAAGPRPITHKGRTERFDGAVMVFSRADEATEGLALLKRKAGDRTPMFLDTVEQGRFHIGFYDKDGKLQFLSKRDIRRALQREPIPGPPTGTSRAQRGVQSGSAAYVPGSGFRGIDSPNWRPNAAARDAVDALQRIAGVERIGNQHRFRVDIPGGEPIKVRIISRSVGDSPVGDPARYHYYPYTRTAVIQVSDRATAESLERAMHHEIAELRERLSGIAGATDRLARGSRFEPGARLSPHDAGRTAEVGWLSRKLGTTTDVEARRSLRRELHAMVEELGLREGLPNAQARLDLVKPRLSVEAQATLADVRRALRVLPAEDAELLREVRRAARADRAAARAALADRRPLRPMANLRRPGDPRGPLPPDILDARAQEAAVARAAASETTLGSLKAARASGALDPIDAPWIGGGAAVAGLALGQLFIDARGRWHLDRSVTIAQIADQLAGLRRAGLADPLQAAAATERVRLSAVRAWEDLRAAAGPVLDAHARLELHPHGGFVMRVKMLTGEEITLPVRGTPTIATGFPRESVPGAPRVSPRMDTAQLAAARRATATAEAEWEHLTGTHAGRVLLGDEANLATFDPHVSKDWLIAGIGGTAISAAEVILDANRDAVVRMVGSSWTPGLKSNPQYQRIRRDFDRRFQVTVDVRIGAFKVVRTAAGGTAFEIAPGHTGEAVISALSGRNRCPPPIAEAVQRVQAAGGVVTGVALRDSDGYYLGYRLTFPTGQQVDVTGAASRFPPADVPFAARDRRFMRRAELQDAPAESGNFAGGFEASAEQAERYARWRRRGGTP